MGAGFNLKGDMDVRCTAIAYNVLNDEWDDKDLGLKTLASKILHKNRSLFVENATYGPDSKEFEQYAKDDVIDQLTLYTRAEAELKALELFDTYMLITKSIVPFADMIFTGMPFDIRQAEEVFHNLGTLQDEVERNLYKIIGRVDLASPKQLQNRLFKELKYYASGLKSNKTGFKTDIKNIEKLAHKYPACELLSAHRTCAKNINTYIEPCVKQYEEYGRVYDFFYLNSRTGRTRTKMFQLLPTEGGRNIVHNETLKAGLADIKLRSMFATPKGKVLISADLSSAEYRYCAVVANDPKMIKMYRTYDCTSCGCTGESSDVVRACPKCGCSESDKFKHGRDLHAFMRDVCNSHGANINRSQAKAVSFCIIFNGTPRKLAIILNLPESKCVKIQAALLDQFKGLNTWQEKVRKIVRGSGVVTDYFGRRRKIDLKERKARLSEDWAIKQAENELINFGCQSPVCLHLQIAMRNFRKRMMNEGLWGRVRTICMIHDELLVECDEELAPHVTEILRYEMENAVDLGIPTPSDVAIATNWGSIK
jgi:DNA polymerase-1